MGARADGGWLVKRHNLAAGTIWEGDFLTAPIEPGHTLAILDGPYGLQKAAWDRVSLDALPEWYAPHLARVSSLLAPSASMYVWNTAEGWARLDPGIRALGWTFRALITWDKGIASLAGKIDTEGCRTWPDVTEVCGFYQRNAAGARVRELRGGRTFSEVARLVGVDSRLPALWEGWPSVHGSCLPTPAQWVRVGGSAAEFPALVAPFSMPSGVSNVWTAPQVSGPERLKGPTGAALHPCQKPLAFAERMIRASTRPGERVLVPFGGTCREAVICEWLARSEPEQARRYDVCELNADGVDYLGPVLAQIRGEDVRGRQAGQLGLFACAS